jgi:hypothetical protein
LKPRAGPSVQPEAAFVLGLHSPINLLPIGARILLEDRGQRRARVFGIQVDSPGQNRLLADVGPGQVEASLHFQMSARLDLLLR